MRLFICTIAILAFSSGLWANDWKIGSSLKGAAAHLTSADMFSKEKLGFWPEDAITLYSLPDGTKLIFSKNYFPFGVLINNNGKNRFLLDYNGDSILDCSPEYLFVPPWVVDRTSKGTDRGEQIINLYEKKFDSFAGSQAPGDTIKMNEFATRLVEIAKDENSADRIYVYFDYLYDIGYKRKEYEIAETSLLNIEKITATTPKSRSAWLIEAIECAYKQKELEKCRKYVEEIVGISPSFVPGLYYQYLLENDPNKKLELKDNLINNYRNHWIIRDRFSKEIAN